MIEQQGPIDRLPNEIKMHLISFKSYRSYKKKFDFSCLKLFQLVFGLVLYLKTGFFKATKSN